MRVDLFTLNPKKVLWHHHAESEFAQMLNMLYAMIGVTGLLAGPLNIPQYGLHAYSLIMFVAWTDQVLPSHTTAERSARVASYLSLFLGAFPLMPDRGMIA